MFSEVFRESQTPQTPRLRTWQAAIAAVAYARRIASEQFLAGTAMTSVLEVAGQHLAAVQGTELVSDMQAILVERELLRLAPDPRAFLSWRNAAGLIDLGARPVLSERAADSIADLESAHLLPGTSSDTTKDRRGERQTEAR